MTQTLDHQPPNLGGLYVQSPAGNQLVFPLKHTEVRAKVTGNVSRVEVTQTFENPFTTTLEAVYIFPLPDEAAVNDMEIRLGDRIISGVSHRYVGFPERRSFDEVSGVDAPLHQRTPSS